MVISGSWYTAYYNHLDTYGKEYFTSFFLALHVVHENTVPARRELFHVQARNRSRAE